MSRVRSLFVIPRWITTLVFGGLISISAFVQAQDVEAVQKRLVDAVNAGELTLEQAGKMMSALKEAQVHELMMHVKARKLMSSIEATPGDEGRERRLAHLAGELKQAVKEGKVSEEEAWAKWKSVTKRAKQAHADRREAGGGADRLRKHAEGMGVSAESLRKARASLQEAGINEERLQKTMGGMLRVIGSAQASGKDFELDPKHKNYFVDEVGLTNEQVELVVSLSRRLAHESQKK